jgi:hypothetical protein
MQNLIDYATSVVSHPHLFARTPAVLAKNWERLKNARGQTVDHDRIGPPSYVIEPACAVITTAESTRISKTVRQIAIRKGYDLPPSAA